MDLGEGNGGENVGRNVGENAEENDERENVEGNAEENAEEAFAGQGLFFHFADLPVPDEQPDEEDPGLPDPEFPRCQKVKVALIDHGLQKVLGALQFHLKQL